MMNFSGAQWLTIVFLDVFLRAGFVAAYFNPIFLSEAVLLSTLHLTLLVLIYHSVAPLGLRKGPAVTTMLFATNILFISAFAFLGVTSCIRDSNLCVWVTGVIAWLGVHAIGKHAMYQVLINVTPVLIVSFLDRRSLTPTRRAARVDLPLSGGGARSLRHDQTRNEK